MQKVLGCISKRNKNVIPVTKKYDAIVLFAHVWGENSSCKLNCFHQTLNKQIRQPLFIRNC